MNNEVTWENPLATDELNRMNAGWCAANRLSAGQGCLLDNPRGRGPGVVLVLSRCRG